MRFSDQFHRYYSEFGAEPPVPTKPVTVYWFRRRVGTIGERVNVTLSPAACRRWGIWTPQPIGKERAVRIEAWMAERTAESK